MVATVAVLISPEAPVVLSVLNISAPAEGSFFWGALINGQEPLPTLNDAEDYVILL